MPLGHLTPNFCCSPGGCLALQELLMVWVVQLKWVHGPALRGQRLNLLVWTSPFQLGLRAWRNTKRICFISVEGTMSFTSGWDSDPFKNPETLLLLLLSRFSRVRPCATPETAAHQASPSLGFFRQEHWSGLPFPSPVHESEKWKWSRLVVSDSLRPHGLQPTRLFRPWDFPGKSTGVGCHCLLQYHL